MLYRLFPWDAGAGDRAPGGPLFVPRHLQGRGRHDDPSRYGAVYLSRSRVSVVAELLRLLQPERVGPHDLRDGGRPYAVAAFDEGGLRGLIDLDEPGVLVERGLRPSGIATRDREATQAIAVDAYEDGFLGLEWWSTVEASWINVTLFAERALDHLVLAGRPDPLRRGSASRTCPG
jgi:hypothetical protein